MSIERIQILGSDYVGAWSVATDKYFLLGNDVKTRVEEIAHETLCVEAIRTRIGGSSLLGIYIAANSKGLLVPDFIEDHELLHLKKSLPDVKVGVMQTDLNALKNNILANDKIALVNPDFSVYDETAIKDALDVEVVRMEIGGYRTVGANNILTNKGLVLNNRANEEEQESVERLLGMKVEQSTANLGALSIGLCAIANSSGLLAGGATTGFELQRMAESLNLD